MKNRYIEIAKERFSSETLDILLKQIELFYKEDVIVKKNRYDVGEDVYLKKGTFIHGIFGLKDGFDFILQNGFISTDFTDNPRPNKICNNTGMWDIKNDCLLSEYINDYSGFTIRYNLGREPDAKTVTELIPYHKFDLVTEKINNDNDIWSYQGEQTKEVRFIPSLVSDKRQIAFILNMESDYAKEMRKNDVWNISFSEDIIKNFIDARYFPQFLKDRVNRDSFTTDREAAIMFGLPLKLVEGVFVGRIIEKDKELLSYIKEKLPECYICNLDGKVIVGNKSN